MINTDITGGNAQSQLFDLLAVVANPQVFQGKLEELQAATKKYQTFVEAVGPADDVLTLRSQATELRKEAEDYRNTALSQADSELKASKIQAKQIVEIAQASAKSITEAANQAKADAAAISAQLKVALSEAQKTTQDSLAAQKAAEDKLASLTQAISDAQASKDDAEALKTSLVAKYEAFLKGI